MGAMEARVQARATAGATRQAAEDRLLPEPLSEADVMRVSRFDFGRQTPVGDFPPDRPLHRAMDIRAAIIEAAEKRCGTPKSYETRVNDHGGGERPARADARADATRGDADGCVPRLASRHEHDRDDRRRAHARAHALALRADARVCVIP